MNKMAKVEDNRIQLPSVVIDKIIDYARDLMDGPAYREQFNKVLRQLVLRNYDVDMTQGFRDFLCDMISSSYSSYTNVLLPVQYTNKRKQYGQSWR